MNQIRLARPGDLDEIWPLVQRAVADMNARGNDQWGEDYPTREHYAADIENGVLWCVTDGESGAILGVGTITCRHEPDYAAVPFTFPEPAVVMHRVAVDPSAMRQGVAGMLFAQFEEEGRRRGVEALRIDTYSLNDRMQALILKQGFRFVADTHFGKRPLPYHCYEKILKEV